MGQLMCKCFNGRCQLGIQGIVPQIRLRSIEALWPIKCRTMTYSHSFFFSSWTHTIFFSPPSHPHFPSSFFLYFPAPSFTTLSSYSSISPLQHGIFQSSTLASIFARHRCNLDSEREREGVLPIGEDGRRYRGTGAREKDCVGVVPSTRSTHWTYNSSSPAISVQQARSESFPPPLCPHLGYSTITHRFRHCASSALFLIDAACSLFPPALFPSLSSN
ncbi:hypothetical protein BC939DRAFT_249303 [Gamsiella multidivaricata]|uniref:uncharacterized protein n=1 Tax=Gamsiella multidivaricata TaxID=101098 RepID=UPI00221F8A45|nr:uncharacterized protein BC939DRAFT_249303 [Gamsiella multidivaricata]KAI7819842.1 hypothetical protein BC939DRAFT_249303 [Gamsiella multidivaricata]